MDRNRFDKFLRHRNFKTSFMSQLNAYKRRSWILRVHNLRHNRLIVRTTFRKLLVRGLIVLVSSLIAS